MAADSRWPEGGDAVNMQPSGAGSTIQCLVALGLILLAFRIADVSPTLAAAPAVEPAAVALWADDLAAVDAALARKDVDTARRRWQAGYVATLASRRWEGLLALGDGARRIGAASGTSQVGDAHARALYLDALFRARQQGAVEGVLRAAAALADLGDPVAAARSLGLARRLAARSGDPQADDRVRALSGQLAAK